jgi:group I intron endonuclease
MIGYIYETTNLINGKKYIGKHKSCNFDKNYYGSGIGLKRALNKYGKENFKIVILEEIETNQKDLDLREVYWIEYFDAVKSKNYYNNSYGGENEGWSGVNKMFRENSDKWKAKVEKSAKTQTGQKRSFETKQKISKSLKGKSKSEEHIKHLRDAKLKFWENASEDLKKRMGYNFGTLGKQSPIKGLNAENSEYVRKARDNMMKTKNSEEWKQTKGLESRKKLSKTRKERGLAKGKNNPMYGTKTVYVSNIKQNKVKRINLGDLDNYLLDGWIKGNIHKMK